MSDSTDPPRARRFGFPKTSRLRTPKEFRRVYGARASRRSGPLVVFTRPNGLDRCRLGISASRRVGNAVVRNRIKRRIREAFRHVRSELPPGYDVVVNVTAHQAVAPDAYGRLLATATRDLHRTWTRTSTVNGPDPGPAP